jgi:RNA-splicing ligase RtcB
LTKEELRVFVIFPSHSTEKHDVNTMELADRYASTPSQSLTSRAERKYSLKVDYYSELRSWVQHAILEAERKEDVNKRDRLLSLLKDL